MTRFRLPISYLPLLIAAMALSTGSVAQVQKCASGVCVTTWHDDNLRTGQNTNETALTTALVENTAAFGKICSTAWPTPDNFVYTAPLVATNVNFNGTLYPYVVYIASMGATVYAINGTNCAILGSQSLLEQGEIPERCADIGNCGQGYDEVGILSTPVIEIDGNGPTTGTLFAVAASEVCWLRAE
jgi:hypothetical protein